MPEVIIDPAARQVSAAGPDPGCACPWHPQPGRRLFTQWLVAGSAAAAGAVALPAQAADRECKRSPAANLIPRSQVEGSAQRQYLQLLQQAQQQGVLAPRDHPQAQRLRYIAQRIIPFAQTCNAHARDWKWDVQLLMSQQLNAFCMPGGKIAFFSAILSRLKLDDDEVAMVMGHEAAHALLEHARERMAKSAGTEIGLRGLAALFGLGNLGDAAARGSAQLLSLQYSRSDESEADALGLVLAARAGYDPRAGTRLWQKMGAASGNGKGGTPGWLSTHPSGAARIKDIEARLARVMPLYEAAAKPDRKFAPAA